MAADATGAPPRPRVLFVGAFPEPGSGIFGGNVTACTSLMASPFSEALEVETLDSTQRAVPPPPGLVRLAYAVPRVARFLWRVDAFRPDVVMVMSAVGLSFLEKAAMGAYARMRGASSILMMRGGPLPQQVERSPLFRRMVHRLLHAQSIVLCQGEWWRRWFGDTFGLPAAQCRVVENWLASDALLDAEPRPCGRDAEVRILFLGWVEDHKGVPELIDAVARLAADRTLPPVRLHLAGDGGGRAEAEARVAAAGLGGRVEFLGWIEGEAKARALAAADVFCLPSHAEGLPNALLEAMAAGLPVVSTPVGSIPDVVAPGENGLLVPVRDAGALAHALRTLVADPALRARIGARAREDARARFSLAAGAQRMIEVVRHAAAESPRWRARSAAEAR